MTNPQTKAPQKFATAPIAGKDLRTQAQKDKQEASQKHDAKKSASKQAPEKSGEKSGDCC